MNQVHVYDMPFVPAGRDCQFCGEPLVDVVHPSLRSWTASRNLVQNSW